MLNLNKRNTNFMLVKEVFIDHHLTPIQHQYDLAQQCLGSGGFGQVFEGRRKRTSFSHQSKENLAESFCSYEASSRCCSEEQSACQPRAIKRISYGQASDRELMQNEMEILSYLDHPLIVKLYETFEHNKQLYLVVDLLKGGDLFTVIDQRGKFCQAEAREVFVQVVRALKYLHSQHICHRDLKLENVVFLNHGDFAVKLVDFGLAYCWDKDMKKELKKSGLNNKTIGTVIFSLTQLDYMSPQILAKNYDQRCDIWSAGVILYMLLSGQAPFQGNTDKDIAQSIKDLDYSLQTPDFEYVTDSAKDLIQKIFKPENQRISLDQILNHPWIQGDDQKDTFQTDTCQSKSISSERRVKKTHTGLKNKNKTTKEIQKHLRKGSHTFPSEFDSHLSVKSCCSEDLNHESDHQQLTVAKLEHYCRFPKLQKFQAIFSVSKLSQTRTKLYGKEFMRLDKDNDGTVSLKDLSQYLSENQGYKDEEKIEAYFNELSLSKRGYISYSEYLACVLAYRGDHCASNPAEELDFDERYSENGRSSDFSEDDTISEPIDLFEDEMIDELFTLLDKNADGEVSKQDFANLLKKNGIESQNRDFISELSSKMKEMDNFSEKQGGQKESKGPWFIDPRTYKDQLSRTYKGESDGGMRVNRRGFGHLMRGVIEVRDLRV